MRLTRLGHAILDYFLGFLILASPWLFGFSGERAAPDLAFAFGGGLIFLSLLTNYEGGLIRMIPFGGHRFFDLVCGVGLAGASWHFDMNGRAACVFTTLGLLLLASLGATRRPRERGTVAT